MTTLTHVTEWGLGLCAGMLEDEDWLPSEGEASRLREVGLRPDTVACDGLPSDGAIGGGPHSPTVDGGDVFTLRHCLRGIPTCPACAVLRDAALEGRLPERKDAAHGE